MIVNRNWQHNAPKTAVYYKKNNCKALWDVCIMRYISTSHYYYILIHSCSHSNPKYEMCPSTRTVLGQYTIFSKESYKTVWFYGRHLFWLPIPKSSSLRRCLPTKDPILIQNIAAIDYCKLVPFGSMKKLCLQLNTSRQCANKMVRKLYKYRNQINNIDI